MAEPRSNLRDRAQGKGVATRPTNAPATVQDQIRSMQDQFAMAMPKGAEAQQLVRDALTCLRQNPGLGECQPASILGSLMTCAQLGLRPGVLGHASLVPFYDGKSRTKKAQLVIGYQGLVELAHRSGKVKSLIARTVYEGDYFDVDYGLADNLVHKPAPNGVERGEPTNYYAIVKFINGGHAFFVMSHTEMLAYRDKFASTKTKDGRVFGPWSENFEAMAHKTCVRQLAKWMPKSTEFATALQADEGVRVDLTPDTDAGSATHHYDYDVEGDVITAEGERTVAMSDVMPPETGSDEDDPWANEKENQ